MKTGFDTWPKIKCQPLRADEVEEENKMGEKVGSLFAAVSQELWFIISHVIVIIFLWNVFVFSVYRAEAVSWRFSDLPKLIL